MLLSQIIIILMNEIVVNKIICDAINGKVNIDENLETISGEQ